MAALRAFAFVSAPADAAPPMPVADVLALPPGEAAVTLLRHIGRRFVTMVVDDDGVSSGIPVVFATAPEAVDTNGLCRATVLHLLLARAQDPTPPPDIWSVQLGDVYRVVGEVQQHIPAPESHTHACAGAGPVLPAQLDDNRARRYFAYTGPGGPWFAVAALQGAVRRAREGRYRRVECVPRSSPTACANPRAALAALDLADLTSLNLAPQGEEPTVNYRLTAVFVAQAAGALPLRRELVMEVNGIDAPGIDPGFSYRRIRLTR